MKDIVHVSVFFRIFLGIAKPFFNIHLRLFKKNDYSLIKMRFVMYNQAVMIFPKVTIGLVLYKGLQYLPYSIGTLLEQHYPGEIEFLFRDQSQEHEALEYIEEHFADKMANKNIRTYKGLNYMHSGGHNRLLNRMTGKYYACLSYDAIYSPHFLRTLVQALEEKPEYSFAAPKIKKWNFRKKKMTDFIDSVGIEAIKGQEFHEKGEGEKDEGQYDHFHEPFGVSCAGALFRKTALDSIAYGSEYFDELLHYKDDVDLSYRLRWAGEKCLFVPDAIMWHDRQVSKDVLKTRKEQSDSFFGHLVTVEKNFSKEFSTKEKIRKAKQKVIRYLAAFVIAPESIQKFLEHRKLIRDKREKTPHNSSPAFIESLFQKKQSHAYRNRHNR
jgi:GT2 family glycosyltransferase